MTEIAFILDPITGETLLEGVDRENAEPLIGNLLPPPQELYCARPSTILHLPAISAEEMAREVCVRIAGFYHNSLIEGPGRRSVAKLQGCSIRCPGCVAKETWDPDGGYLVSVDRLADALLDPAYERDGTSILGGEPFQQPEGLLGLVRALRERGCLHILCYSGYTYEALRRRESRHPAIGAVLDQIEMLIDGPYVEPLAAAAGPWTGSANQRVIDLVATRRTGAVIRWDGSIAECQR